MYKPRRLKDIHLDEPLTDQELLTLIREEKAPRCLSGVQLLYLSNSVSKALLNIDNPKLPNSSLK